MDSCRTRRPRLKAGFGILPALLEEGRCGFLAGDNLAEAIAGAFADRERLAEMGRRGRKRVEGLHSWERVAAETLQLYPLRVEANAAPRR